MKFMQTAENDPKLSKKKFSLRIQFDRISAPRDFKEQCLGQKNEL